MRAFARAIAAATASFLLALSALFSDSVLFDSAARFAFRSRACCLRSSRNFAISELSGSAVLAFAASACFALARAIAAATAGLGLAIPDSSAAF